MEYPLTDFRELPNLRRRGPIHELKLGSWLSVPRRYSIAVLIEPPDYVAAGELKVHVTRKSTGETAIVEFSLDPKAQGPGCYRAVKCEVARFETQCSPCCRPVQKRCQPGSSNSEA